MKNVHYAVNYIHVGERITMINTVKDRIRLLAKSGFVHIISSSIINKIITFACGIILVRIISKEAYGVYSYANNILGFFMLASGWGASSAVLQLCSEGKSVDKRQKFYRFGCFFGLGFNILLGIIIVSSSFLITLPIKGANYFLALMCFLPFVHLMSDLQIMYLRTELRNKEYAYANILCTVLYFISVACLALLFKTEGLIAAQYLAYLTSAVLIVLIYKVPVSFSRLKLSKQERKDFFSISGISVINNGLSKLMYLLDIFVLGIVVPDDTVIASYKVATNIPTALLFIPASVVIFIYPYFARNKDNKKWVTVNFKRVLFYLGLFNVILALGMYAFAPVIIKIIFGSQYLDAVGPFRILCISYIFSGTFRTISGNILITQRKLKFNLFVSIVSSGLNTILNYFMIKAYGSIGAAWATLITAVFCALLSTPYLMYTFSQIDKESEVAK